MADPAPVVQTFIVDPEVQRKPGLCFFWGYGESK